MSILQLGFLMSDDSMQVEEYKFSYCVLHKNSKASHSQIITKIEQLHPRMKRETHASQYWEMKKKQKQ